MRLTTIQKIKMIRYLIHMTKPKPSILKAKRGRKTKREKRRLAKLMKTLATKYDLTAWEACLVGRCGYDYTLKNFRDGRYFRRMALARIKRPVPEPYDYPLDKRGKKFVLKCMSKYGIT